jgi:hypothetical protein
MFEVQFSAQESVMPSQAEALFVELDDAQLATVSGGLLIPVGGWAPAESSRIPVAAKGLRKAGASTGLRPPATRIADRGPRRAQRLPFQRLLLEWLRSDACPRDRNLVR